MLYRTADTLKGRFARPTACLTCAALLSPILLTGCDNGTRSADIPAPRDASSGEMSRMNPAAAPTKAGMSTKKKLVLLAGAAALYYIYKKKQAANAAPKNVQYYLSKNGRVYYRDPKTKQAIWVTPPPSQAPTYQIPESEAMDYRDIQGYSGNKSGNGLDHYFKTQ